VTHTQTWGTEIYRFEDVPALVCVQCGHVWLAAEVSQSIDAIIQDQA
jgi:YgiT-type zinc finger domain-containing protein